MKHTHNLIIDIVALVIYLVAANPAITGLGIHEWVSLGLILVFIIHCATHFDWIVDTIRRHAANVQTANLVLDVVTLVVFMVVSVSGIMVSRFVLPLFGFVAPGYFFWNPVHAVSAKMLLAFLIVHVAVHLKWFTSLRTARHSSAKRQEDSDEN